MNLKELLRSPYLVLAVLLYETGICFTVHCRDLAGLICDIISPAVTAMLVWRRTDKSRHAA